MKKFIMRIFGIDKYIDNLKNQYHELSYFVWDNCVMTDSTGRSEGDYNSTEVSEKWKKYFELTENFKKSLK